MERGDIVWLKVERRALYPEYGFDIVCDFRRGGVSPEDHMSAAGRAWAEGTQGNLE